MLYAPAICPDCNAVYPSDVPIATEQWLTPIYRAIGGTCPRCSGTGRIPTWTYSFHAVVVTSRLEATEHQRQAQIQSLGQHLRRHRTAKRTQSFIQDFRGPWKPLIMPLKATPPRHRRAQLTFLLWILDAAE